MAMTVDKLEVLITANTQQLQNEIKQTNSKIANIGSSASSSSSKLVSAFVKSQLITKALSVAVSAVTNNLGDAISRLDTLNNYTNVMSNLGVSSDDAEASISRLSDKLTGLPTTLDDAVSSVQRFTSANNNVKASTDMFLALNNAILAGGASTQVQSSALEQLSQAYAKGKPDMMEWRSAMTAMPAQLNQVASAMGYVNADLLGEALRGGTVSMNEFMSTLVKLNSEGVNGFQSFEQQALNATGGVQTSMTNVKTAITRGLAEIMNAIGQSNIAGFFQNIAKAINACVPYITGFVKACVWAVNSISKLFGGKGVLATGSKTASSASSGISSLGSSASSTASDLDNANSSAGKLNKTLGKLAGFDEMNVLTENSSSGSSGSSGDTSTGGVGDLGDFDFSDWDTELDGVSSKADQIAEKIQSVFAQIGATAVSVWNSEPVQAYVNLVTTELNFLAEFFTSMGSTLLENITLTWGNIEGNVSNILSNMSYLFTSFWTETANTIDTWGEPIITDCTNLFDSIWKDALDPAVTQVTQMWSDMSDSMVTIWDEHGANILNSLGEFVDQTIKNVQAIWDGIISPILEPFLEDFKWLWDNYLSDTIEAIGEFVATCIEDALEIYNKFISPIVQWLSATLAPVVSVVAGLISNYVSGVFSVISTIATSIFGVLTGIVDFVTGVFTGNWSKAWNGISQIFSSIWNGLVGLVKSPINNIIGIINSFIRGLNKIKVPSWVPAIGGKGINIPTIPKLAEGGVVESPTVAMVGEAGKEAVMPLERNTGWIDELADKLGDKVGTGDNKQRVTIQIGDETVFDRMIDYINDKSFQRNGGVVTV